jgi:hypothetical protein
MFLHYVSVLVAVVVDAGDLEDEEGEEIARITKVDILDFVS